MTIYSNISTSSMDYVSYYMYIVEGYLLFSLNLLLAMFIIWRKEMKSQKDYVIYLGNMLHDSFYGLGFAVAGTFRISVFLTEAYIPLYSSWMCFNMLQSYIWVLTTPASGLIILVSAIDRFISVMFPIQHMKISINYSYVMISLPILLCSPYLIIGGIQSYERKDIYNIPLICNLVNGDMPPIFFSMRWVRVVSTVVAVLMYLPILIKVYYVINSKAHTALNIKQRKNMGKATLTVGLLAANELIMFVMPDIFVYISPKSSYNFIFFVMTLNKGFVNMLLLLMTQKELRQEILKVLSKKWFIKTGPIIVIKKPSEEVVTKLMIRRVVLYKHGSI